VQIQKAAGGEVDIVAPESMSSANKIRPAVKLMAEMKAALSANNFGATQLGPETSIRIGMR
jgi:hypothetical protein